MNTYIIIFWSLCALCGAILLWVFRDGVAATYRWFRFQYNVLPDGFRGLLHGYIGVGIAEVWLHVLHWSAWLLVTLSVLAVVHALVQYARATRRDIDHRVKQMLRNNRSRVHGVLFLTGTFGLALGYAWLKWILTHEVK